MLLTAAAAAAHASSSLRPTDRPTALMQQHNKVIMLSAASII